MAFPDVMILSFDESRISDIKYEDIENVSVTEAFIIIRNHF